MNRETVANPMPAPDEIKVPDCEIAGKGRGKAKALNYCSRALPIARAVGDHGIVRRQSRPVLA